jgi:hypothetical protein
MRGSRGEGCEQRGKGEAAGCVAAVPNLDLVRSLAKTIDRLRRGELGRVCVVGLSEVDPERAALTREVVQDMSDVLGREVQLRARAGGDTLELWHTLVPGETAVLDVAYAPPRELADLRVDSKSRPLPRRDTAAYR